MSAQSAIPILMVDSEKATLANNADAQYFQDRAV
jgi:hypothetical protein